MEIYGSIANAALNEFVSGQAIRARKAMLEAERKAKAAAIEEYFDSLPRREVSTDIPKAGRRE